MAAESRHRDDLETPRLSGWPFTALVAAVVVFLAASLGGLWGVFVRDVPNRGQRPAQEPPQPRLLSNPPAELSKVLADQRARLTGYRWTDRGQGLIAVPIDRAMAIVAARGANAYEPIPGAPPPPQPNIPEILNSLQILQRQQEALPATPGAPKPQTGPPAGNQ
jgi:hypothetical protein